MMPANIDSTSYVVAATDLHQLQQSGGQLLVQTTAGSRQDRLAVSRQHQHNIQQQVILHADNQQIPVTSQQEQQQQQMGVSCARFATTSSQPAGVKRVEKSRSVPAACTSSSAAGETVKFVPFDRPFKCDKCTASFIEQDECEEHKRKHSGDGPFTCEDCHFNFMYKSHYKSHKARCEKKRASMPPQQAAMLKAPVVPIKREFPTHDTLRENHVTNTRKRNNVRTPVNKLGVKTSSNVVFTSSEVSQASSQDIYTYSKFNISDAEELAADDPTVMTTAPSAKAASLTPVSSLKKSFPNTKIKKEAELNKFNPVLPSFKRLKHQHNTARPYECDSCDASFTNSEDLDTHRQKHSSDGPYRCDSCQYLYLYRRLYDAHKRKCKKGRSKRDGPIGAALQPQTSTQHHQQSPATGVAVQVNQGTSGQFSPNMIEQQHQQQQSLHLHNPQQSNLMLIEQQPQTFKSVQTRSVQLQPNAAVVAGTDGHVSAGSHHQQHYQQQQQQHQLQPIEMSSGTTALLVGGQGGGGSVIDAQHLQLHTLHGTGVQVLELRGDELVAVASGDSVRGADGETVKYELVQTVDPSSVPHIMGLLKKGAMGPAVAQ